MKHALFVVTMALVSGACATPAPERDMVDGGAAPLRGVGEVGGLAFGPGVLVGGGRRLALGWVRVGDIPNYALYPQGGFCSTTYFYRHLAD